LKGLFLPLIFILFLLSIRTVNAQVDRGGVPRSFSAAGLKSSIPVTEIMAPDASRLRAEDDEADRLEKSQRAGVELPVSISSDRTGIWEDLPGGGRLWRIRIRCAGAEGIGIIFDNPVLPEGADMFVYTPDHQFIAGSYSRSETLFHPRFFVRPLPGQDLMVEYYLPDAKAGTPAIVIKGLAFIYRGVPAENTVSGTKAGSCEVNMNCSEGQDWQHQKHSVVKILTKVGSRYFYCTGTVMNNTAQDFSGLLLTASHCSSDFSGGVASESDYAQWTFYFNYETPGCSQGTGIEYTMVGAEKLAISDDPANIGSDFLLLRFANEIPASYYPYYCGWDAGGSGSQSGVCIHHPDGDVKKISTYTDGLTTGTWGSSPETHWVVSWAGTANGHGVTEGGSSGSPLFSENGLVIGTLTGGESSCSNLNGADYFGRVSYSWASNGSTASRQLKPWLDPAGTGLVKCPGSFNEKFAVADFSANIRTIPAGGTVNFQDLSSGKPNSWHWYFQGGKPAESNEQNPSGIRFDHYGKANVKLLVTNEYNSDTLVREAYIDVQAVISPNPSQGVIQVLTDINIPGNVQVEVFDVQGRILQKYTYESTLSGSHSIQLPYSGTIFLVRVIQGNVIQTHKVIVARR
jgi:PKD repeat protein